MDELRRRLQRIIMDRIEQYQRAIPELQLLWEQVHAGRVELSDALTEYDRITAKHQRDGR